MLIDYIFPWVNPNDEYWRLLFYKYRRPDDVNDCRFRDFGLLKYVFRGIAKNMPWINKVHIILAQDSQVPDWLNNDEVNIVYHKDYIPTEFLPTFNSNTIESYLGRIKGLSEHFIYGNDDFYPIGPSSPEDWFTEDGKPKIRYYSSSDTNTSFKMFCKKNFDDIANIVGTKFPKDYYIRPNHYSTPLLLSSVIDVYKLLEKNIKNGTSRLRDFGRNYNHYAYVAYMVLMNQNAQVNVMDGFGKYMEKTQTNTAEHIAEFIKNQNASIICINDTEKTDTSNMETVVNAFDELLPEKCKYEK